MKKYISISLFAFLILACKKGDTKLNESPFFDFLKLTSISIDTITHAASVWEYGFRFKPLTDGVISKLGINVPVVGDFVVRLYNIDNNQILAEKLVHSEAVGKESFIEISPITVNQESDLGVSIRADVFFKVKNLNGLEFSFPETKGNLNIISFNEEICGTGGCQTFPVNSNSLVIAPCVNLVFTAD